MTKQTISGRVAQLARADVKVLLDQAEDPQKTVDGLVRAYTATIREADDAATAALGHLRMLEQDHAEDVAAAAEWGGKAAAASRKGDELRSGTTPAPGEADRFDHLAKIALSRQLRSEHEARAAEPVITAQQDLVDALRTGLTEMKERLRQLRSARDDMVTRSRAGKPRNTPLDAVRSVDVLDPTGDLGRFEDKIRREEARARGRRELAASSLDAEFESLDAAAGDTAEVEARLARLKAQAA